MIITEIKSSGRQRLSVAQTISIGLIHRFYLGGRRNAVTGGNDTSQVLNSVFAVAMYIVGKEQSSVFSKFAMIGVEIVSLLLLIGF